MISSQHFLGKKGESLDVVKNECNVSNLADQTSMLDSKWVSRNKSSIEAEMQNRKHSQVQPVNGHNMSQCKQEKRQNMSNENLIRIWSISE